MDQCLTLEMCRSHQHVRCRSPGAAEWRPSRGTAVVSHLAFHFGTTADVDVLWSAVPRFGWKHLYADRHPWVGGEEHYAAFVESGEQSMVELVATL